MRPSLLAVVRAGLRPAGPGRPGIDPTLPLCGKSLLRWGVEKAAGLGPGAICAVGAPGFPPEESIDDLPAVRFLPGDGPGGALEDFLSFGTRRAQRRNTDLLILDLEAALVRGATLRRLIARHRSEGNAVTALAGSSPRDARAADGRLAGIRDWPALVIRLEDFARAWGRQTRKGGLSGRLATTIEALASQPEGCAAMGLPEKDRDLTVRSAEDASRIRLRLNEEKRRRLEARGIILLDPSATWIDWDVRIGAGTIICPAVVIEGRSIIGKDCRIHPFVNLIDARLGNRVGILSSTVIEGGIVGSGAQVGPYTHFRPGTVIRAGARVGNFVEMKNTVFGRRSLAGHLSYLGDATVGDDVNIGAGTITCNFDRFKKNPTSIGSGAFIGSGAKLVAPVKVGRNAVVGAGSTITKDVSAWALAVARSRQKEFKNWAKRKPGK